MFSSTDVISAGIVSSSRIVAAISSPNLVLRTWAR